MRHIHGFLLMGTIEPLVGSLIISSDRVVENGYNIYSLSGTNFSNKLFTHADIGTNFTPSWYGDGSVKHTWMALIDYSGHGANITMKFLDLNNTLAKTEYVS